MRSLCDSLQGLSHRPRAVAGVGFSTKVHDSIPAGPGSGLEFTLSAAKARLRRAPIRPLVGPFDGGSSTGSPYFEHGQPGFMVGDSLGPDPDEFLGVSLDPTASGRRRGPAEPGRSAGELASARAAHHDFFLGGVLDGVMWPGVGIVHVYLAGSDIGLGGA